MDKVKNDCEGETIKKNDSNVKEDCCETFCVVAWMSLPLPYKAESEE